MTDTNKWHTFCFTQLTTFEGTKSGNKHNLFKDVDLWLLTQFNKQVI